MKEWARSHFFVGVIVCGLLAVTLYLSFHVKGVTVAALETADVKARLPNSIANWQGEDLWYCQGESCARSFHASDLGSKTNCSFCAGRLDLVSLGERTLLPADTTVVRKSYRDALGTEIVVTIVISGVEQRSIHRPQQCLPGQGYAIESTYVVKIPLAGRPPLLMTVVDAKRGASLITMAYWFMGGGHETHDHFQRMGYMAWDNLVKGVRPRWAYVSVQTFANTGEKAAENRISQFVRQLYPLLKPGAINGKAKTNIEQSTSNVQP